MDIKIDKNIDCLNKTCPLSHHHNGFIATVNNTWLTRAVSRSNFIPADRQGTQKNVPKI